MGKEKLNKLFFVAEAPEIDTFWELFNTTDWNDKYKFTKTELKASLENNWYGISVYSDEKLIGFGRIISDGIYHALIADLIILPEFQGLGIGSKLLKALLDKCTAINIRDIQLFAAKNKFGFYEKFGFQKRPENAPGMQYYYPYD